jgi:hypothetical protein
MVAIVESGIVPDGIPNEIIKFLSNATRSVLLSFLAHKAYTPPRHYGATSSIAYYTKK